MLPTTSKTLIEFFKENDVDYIVAVCNACGLSAYHFIEWRMAPLSKELAGIILPHDSYGNHLDGNGKTIGGEKELQNFKKTGETLAEIWSSAKIDEYPVSAAWVDPIIQKSLRHSLIKNWEENGLKTIQEFQNIKIGNSKMWQKGLLQTLMIQCANSNARKILAFFN